VAHGSPAPRATSLRVVDGGAGRLLTPVEVAERLGVCRDTVYRLVRPGRAPARPDRQRYPDRPRRSGRVPGGAQRTLIGTCSLAAPTEP
jgi:excisionase family DNA binding protein